MSLKGFIVVRRSAFFLHLVILVSFFSYNFLPAMNLEGAGANPVPFPPVHATIHADQVIIHEKGSHSNINLPSDSPNGRSAGENIVSATQSAVAQGYKHAIVQLISGLIVAGVYKVFSTTYSYLLGPTAEQMAQQQSEHQKKMGNILLLLRNNAQLMKECDDIACANPKCDLEKKALRETLAQEHASLLEKLAAQRTMM